MPRLMKATKFARNKVFRENTFRSPTGNRADRVGLARNITRLLTDDNGRCAGLADIYRRPLLRQ
jgi:hypothetical protein